VVGAFGENVGFHVYGSLSVMVHTMAISYP